MTRWREISLRSYSSVANREDVKHPAHVGRVRTMSKVAAYIAAKTPALRRACPCLPAWHDVARVVCQSRYCHRRGYRVAKKHVKLTLHFRPSNATNTSHSIPSSHHPPRYIISLHRDAISLPPIVCASTYAAACPMIHQNLVI